MTTASSAPLSPRAVGAPVSSRLPAAPRSGRLRPLGMDEVSIDGGFWGHRQQLNRETIIPHIAHWMERMGWTTNFDHAVTGGLPERRSGREFSDSEIYKLLEGLAWEIGRTGDPGLEELFQNLASRVAAAQEPDGYLNTMFGRQGQAPRYSDMEWGHELYCFGHLIQAGVARARSHGTEDVLVRTALAAADHVCREFGSEDDTRLCGHPEIETALVELWRVTGEQKYLRQAQLFLERRGHGHLRRIFLGQQYFQDETPIREASALRGHAVRALYLSSGAVDAAVETEDEDLLRTLRDQVRHTLARRTYLTGGMGAHHEGESFGEDFVLPPDRSYSESCAGVASIQLNHRLLLATGDPVHADAVERTLYNILATAVGEDGRSFYYTNTLHQREPGHLPQQDEVSPRAASGMRAPWFEVSCCPTNITRTLASLAAYVATADHSGLQLQQYMPATVHTTLPDGGDLRLKIETNYPYSSEVLIRVTEAPQQPWTLSLRIPQWAAGASMESPDGGHQQVQPGYAEVPGSLRAGQTVRLQLPVGPRWTVADERIDAVRGQVAVECGPLVMALESVDLVEAASAAEADVSCALADTRWPLRQQEGRTLLPVRLTSHTEEPWPYRSRPPQSVHTEGQPQYVPLIPYHHWANRGPSTMRVWIPHVPAETSDAELDTAEGGRLPAHGGG